MAQEILGKKQGLGNCPEYPSFCELGESMKPRARVLMPGIPVRETEVLQKAKEEKGRKNHKINEKGLKRQEMLWLSWKG